MTMDPHAEKYYSISPYAYCANNPVNATDPTGKDPTHVDGAGNVNINLPGGEDIVVVDQPLPTVEVTAQRPFTLFGETPRPSQSYINWYNTQYEGTYPMPDYVGISVEATAIVGGGFSVNGSVGEVKGDEIVATGGYKAGSGFDISLSVSLVAADYVGEGKPSAKSMAGKSFSENAAVGMLTGGATQDFLRNKETDKLTVGSQWRGGSFGLCTSGLVSGSAGVTMTSKPLYFKKY